MVAQLMLHKTLKPGRVRNDTNDHANENGVDWVAQVGREFFGDEVFDDEVHGCRVNATVVVCCAFSWFRCSSSEFGQEAF